MSDLRIDVDRLQVALHGVSAGVAEEFSTRIGHALEQRLTRVPSPFVGTFYRRPNPDSPAYVELNERVEKGQVLCIVEAMKLMNEIENDVRGRLVEVLATRDATRKGRNAGDRR